jgi:hypothetical protein
VNPLETDLREQRDIRSTGAAVPETSYCGPPLDGGLVLAGVGLALVDGQPEVASVGQHAVDVGLVPLAAALGLAVRCRVFTVFCPQVKPVFFREVKGLNKKIYDRACFPVDKIGFRQYLTRL